MILAFTGLRWEEAVAEPIGNVSIDGQCRRIDRTACESGWCEWSARVRWCLSRSAAIVTQLVTRLRAAWALAAWLQATGAGQSRAVHAGALGTDQADLRARWSRGQGKRPSRSSLESRFAW